jgi:large subunit ribosomal protein L27
LGVKLYAGEKAVCGNIIVRQKGSRFNPGLGVRMGNDFTIYAVKEGKVAFSTRRGDKVVSVI